MVNKSVRTGPPERNFHYLVSNSSLTAVLNLVACMLVAPVMMMYATNQKLINLETTVSKDKSLKAKSLIWCIVWLCM